MTNTRTIGMLAKQVGVGVETIRFYEREGLIPRPPKGGGPRHYDDDAAAMLRYIRIAQRMGLTLKDVRGLQGKLTERSDFCASLRATVEAKLASLASEAAEIVRLQQELQAFLSRCRARDPTLACPIVEELARLNSAVSPPNTPLQKERT